MKFLDLDGLNTLKNYIKKTYVDNTKLGGLNLYGESFNDKTTDTKGLRLGIRNGGSDFVNIPIVKPGDASTYGLMSGADKAKLDGLSDDGGSTVADPTSVAKIVRFDSVVTEDVTIAAGSISSDNCILVYLKTKKIFAVKDQDNNTYYNNGDIILNDNPGIWVSKSNFSGLALNFVEGYKAIPNAIYVDKDYKMYVGGVIHNLNDGGKFCNVLNVINVTNIPTNEIDVPEIE